MATSVATYGFGSLLKRGDGGVGAGVQSFKTWGTSNTSIRIKVKTAGAAGNGRSITVASSGASFVLTTLTQTAISITIPTTATVAQVIAWLYAQANFNLYWDADYNSVGDGSGVCPAQTVTTTAGGSDGTEIFTTVSELKTIGGPQFSQGTTEVTHMESPNAYREYIATLLDAGEISSEMNFTNVAAQTNLIVDLENRVRRNFQLTFVTAAGTATWSFSGLVTNFEPNFAIEDAISASVTIKITGPVTRA